MSIDINYCDTLLSALSKNYTSGDYVRTFGFASVGDGGAAIYKVVSDAPAPSGVVNCTFANTSFNCGEGKFYVSGGTIFQLVPQSGKVYAEQFGVFSGDTAYAAGNITLLNKAVAYAAQNGCVLTFATGGVYYLNPGSIYVRSGMHIDGNSATLQMHGDSDSGVDLFALLSTVNNVSICNITLAGRRTAANEGSSDQGIHIKGTNLNVKNVIFKHFFIALHTYGGDEVQYDTETDSETETDTDTENKTYIIADIPNKNWLIDSCKTESCVFGINTSEIDGLVIKDSDISCYTTSNDTAHCVYLSSNCSNIRVAGCSLHDVSGDAIHKVYPYSEKLDLSKNHFYTDLSIHYADSALDIDFISRNVMCDNVFATEVAIALELSAADNCIVSNSYFSQTRATGDMKAFIYAKKACNCWLQNSYAYYKGQHRVTYQYQESNMLSTVFKDKKHRRMFIGPDFDIPNHWFKFTGCEFESDRASERYYFKELFGDKGYLLADKSQFGEYLDNCCLIIDTSSEMFRIQAVNDLFGGITYRNCYLKNLSAGKDQPPFRMWCKYPALLDVSPCESNTCPVNPSFACALYATGKKYPWIRFENNIFDNFMYPVNNISWYLLLKEGKPKDTTYNAPQRSLVPNYLNAYLSNGYKLNGNVFSSILNLMKK